MKLLKETWQHYSEQTGYQLSDHRYFCYHTPIPRLVENAHKRLMRALKQNEQIPSLDYVLQYNRLTGNCYTASLYLGLISLLENCPIDLTQQRIGFYSYGSGCSGEFFAGIVEKDYKKVLHDSSHQQLLQTRTSLNYEQYLQFYQADYPATAEDYVIPIHTTGQFRLAKISSHQRIYEINSLQTLSPSCFADTLIQEVV